MQNKIFPEFWQKWSDYLPEEIKQPKLSARANKIYIGMPVYSTSQGQTLFLRAKTRKNSSYNETGTRLRRLFKSRCAVQFKTLQFCQSTGETTRVYHMKCKKNAALKKDSVLCSGIIKLNHNYAVW